MHCTCFGGTQNAWTGAPVLLAVGLKNAGKSLLVQRLSDICKQTSHKLSSVVPADAVSLIPTIGTELTKLMTSRGRLSRSVVIREVGGVMQSLWHHYFTEAVAVLFVVDAAAAAFLADANTALLTLLQHQDLQGKPLCVVLNKSDAPGVLSRCQLDAELQLDDLKVKHQERLHVCATSAMAGEGLVELLQWISGVLEQQGKHGKH